MDARDGKIYENPARLPDDLKKNLIQMSIPPTARQRRRGRVGRNEPCFCGSGKKFKLCHWTGR